ncbi:hypothetical protein [Frankia sp. Cj3]|uniref:hypothetical protein n=1 Tax=Frankia sp. Cj3 TaxID=2880976 RepID=UPI001EF5BC24|nr:hypothetical protein [Frankia sp. Cj3]
MPVVVGLSSATSRATPIAPPDPTAPVVSLLRAAVPDADDERWQLGFAFRPYSAAQAETIDMCERTTANGRYPGSNNVRPTNESRVDYVPFTIVHDEICSALGFQIADGRDRALTGIVGKTPAAVEYELWSGELAQVKGYPQHYLSMPAVADGGPVVDLTPVVSSARVPQNPLRALGLLEQALSNAGRATPSGSQAHTQVSTGQPMGPGRRGMIHCTAEMVPQWDGNSLLRREGNRLLTILDSIIVPGSGYLGTGPGGISPPSGCTWVYATSMIHVRLDDPYFEDDDVFATFDRATNTVVVRVMRTAAAYWDYAAHFAVLAKVEV